MSAGALAELHEEIRAHAGCGFEPCEGATRMVPGEGSASAEVMFVGEAPGASEDEQGRPFVGRAGRVLWSCVEEAGLDRAAIFVTNAVKHFKHEDRGPRRLDDERAGSVEAEAADAGRIDADQRDRLIWSRHGPPPL